MKNILGIRYGHDAGACLLQNGIVVADVAEERFTRKKNDGSFPLAAIEYCLQEGDIFSNDLDTIAIPSHHAPDDLFRFFPGLSRPEAKPVQKKSLNPFHWFKSDPIQAPPADDGLAVYMKRFPVSPKCRLVTMHHHRAHAAASYYGAGLDLNERSLVVVMDGIGEGVSVSIWRGENNKLERLAAWGADASLGWFYSSATEAMGWRHGSDEWKLMGLAPYGKPSLGLFDGLHPIFKNGDLVRGVNYGGVHRYPDHGTHHYHLEASYAFKERLGKTSREDFAHEVQRVTEEQAMEIILPWIDREQAQTLCCAGGFFLNVKFNGKLWETGKIARQHIYPNPGDGGLPVGAALHAFHEATPETKPTPIEHLYHGPEFSSADIEESLRTRKIPYTRPDNLYRTVAEILANNSIVGWFQGRMEAGPRALGNRSILMSPLKAENKDTINASVKYREAFRPFCPSLLEEKREDYLEASRDERYMITAFNVTEAKRDAIPAVVHVDGSLRPQTVNKDINPRYHALIKAFGDITGEYILLNTSFNVMGEPIVCSPSEAIRCFFNSGLDYLVLGDYLIGKGR